MTLLNQLAFERLTRNVRPVEPTGPATAAGIIAAYQKATGELAEERPQGNDAAAAGARAILAAYWKALGKSDE
jgi:hypothetical protein